MKPKKLNLQEMWELYLLLQKSIDGRERKELLLDEIETIINLIPEGTLVKCLHILYNNLEENLLGVQKIGLFLQGLRDNEFFGFCDFIKGLSNGAS